MSGFRVIYHEPVCPDCGSFDVTSDEVETGDGLTETAHLCRSCGTAWPVACVTDWTVTASTRRASGRAGPGRAVTGGPAAAARGGGQRGSRGILGPCAAGRDAVDGFAARAERQGAS